MTGAPTAQPSTPGPGLASPAEATVLLQSSPPPEQATALFIRPTAASVAAQELTATVARTPMVSEERAEPTFVGEHAPQDRNEGGRDAAASGRWEKINGLLRPATIQ